MAFFTMLRRALPLASRSPRIPQIAAISTTTIPCRRNQRLTPHFSRAIGVSQIRQLSTAITEEPSADKNLIGALEEEIVKAPEVSPPDGFPFEIQDSAGSREVILQRRCGDEQVRIVVDMSSTEDGMEACLCRFTLRATVTKLNGEMLGFNILVGRRGFGADGVDVRSSGAPDDECFGISDRPFGERLDTAFLKYLGARGIDDKNINFLFDYIADKKKRASSIMFNKMKKLGPFMLL